MVGARLRLALVLVLICVLSLGVPPQSIFAATITVNTTVDEFGTGAGCSFREAIQAANTDTAFGGCPAGGGDDVISFAASTNGAVIAVGATSTITGNLRIVGNGASQTVISGSNAVRILVVTTGVSVELSALQLTRGVHADSGGAVRNDGTLTVTDSILIDNTVFNSGGAIFSPGPLIVRRSTFTGNRTTFDGGGAIYMDAQGLVSDSTFSNNRSDYGGAIYAKNGVQVTNSVFTSNAVTSLGGALAGRGTSAVTASTFRSNQATSPSSLGGFQKSGGAIYLFNNGSMTVDGSTFEQNSADAILVGDSAVGGAIFSEGSLTITSSAFHRNSTSTTNPSTQSAGGAIDAIGQTLIAGSTISENSSRLGGGIFAGGSLALTMTNSTVSGNIGVEGGGLYVTTNNAASLSYSTITANTAPQGAHLRALGAPRLRAVVLGPASSNSCQGTVQSQGSNLATDSSCFPNGNGDGVVSDLKLGPLADNGGPTQTHALLTGSPAIDFVSGTCAVTTDQRGAARPKDGNSIGTATCDSGAFELDSPGSNAGGGSTPGGGPGGATLPGPALKPDDDKDDKKRGSEEQQRQRERTNKGNRDDIYTEGNVMAVHLDAQPPYVELGNGDGLVKVVLLCGNQCPTIRVGDYLEVDGEKQHEQLFEATEVTVTRAGR